LRQKKPVTHLAMKYVQAQLWHFRWALSVMEWRPDAFGLMLMIMD